MNNTVMKTIQCNKCGADIEVEWQDGLTPETMRFQNVTSGWVACDPCIAKREARNKSDAKHEHLMRTIGSELVTNNILECRNMRFFEDEQLHDWDFQVSFVLHGYIRRGKTSLARKLLHRAFQAGYAIGETTGAELALLGTSFDRTDRVRFNALMDVEVLLIDDLDKAAWTRHNLSGFWNMMNARENVSTIITTNSSPAQCQQSLEARSDNATLIRAAFSRLTPRSDIHMTTDNRKWAGDNAPVALHPTRTRRPDKQQADAIEDDEDLF